MNKVAVHVVPPSPSWVSGFSHERDISGSYSRHLTWEKKARLIWRSGMGLWGFLWVASRQWAARLSQADRLSSSDEVEIGGGVDFRASSDCWVLLSDQGSQVAYTE